MNIDIVIVHFTLGVFLFFIINWIGKHSYSIGYMQISMFLKVEESPAFNFIFRILSPVVFLFLISALLYGLKLDRYVKNIYLVSLYYLAFRLVFNLITNRGLLMNWSRQLLQWIGIITISFFAYSRIIIKKNNLLPDFDSLSNELWIIILLFLFQILNGIRLSNRNTVNRKKMYLSNRYKLFYTKYQTYIEEITADKKLQALVYAIMIYEDFNRPKVVRIAENLSFFFSKKEHTLGVMQVKTKRLINDRKSVILGVNKILTSYHKQRPKIIKKRKKQKKKDEKSRKELFSEMGLLLPKRGSLKIVIHDSEIITGILKDYNPDFKYIFEVNELFNQILIMFDYDKNIQFSD